MKASRIRTVSSARRVTAANPASSEVLEGRRLFAAFGPGHGGYLPPAELAIFMASRVPPMQSWQSQTAANRAAQSAASTAGTASTAESTSNASVDTSAVAAVTSGGTSVPVRFVTTPATYLQARTTDAAAPAASNVIDQVMTTSGAAATTTSKSAGTDAAGDAGPTFGSYAVKLADIESGRTKTIESGLVDLLAVNAQRNSRLAVWQVEASANARRVTSAETSADLAEGELPTINSDEAVMQAALPILPGDVSMRPLWQRVALFTATGVIFAANWIIRRKQRKLALALKA